jgi:ABC-2 type transport system ATP-binding protein
MSAIETHALAKDYKVGFWRPRPYRALDGLTLAVEPGEVFGFLGPNGAGKTTTLKLLMQLVYPTSGTASILGRPLGDLEMKRRIGFLPENPYFYDYLTAEELLTYFAGLFGYRGPDRAKRVGRLLDEVGLGGERRLQLRKFSKGMIQRVGLAQTLINDPEVIFLDEPMSGLDPLGRRDVRALILRLRDEGRTVFFSSHILSDAESLCSRIAIVAKGRLMAAGTLTDLVTTQLKGWEITLDAMPQAPSDSHAGVRAVTAIAAGRYAIDALPTSDPLRLARELTVNGGRLVSIIQVHDTLEDLFVRQVDQASGTDRFAAPPAAAQGGAR